MYAQSNSLHDAAGSPPESAEVSINQCTKVSKDLLAVAAAGSCEGDAWTAAVTEAAASTKTLSKSVIALAARIYAADSCEDLVQQLVQNQTDSDEELRKVATAARLAPRDALCDAKSDALGASNDIPALKAWAQSLAAIAWRARLEWAARAPSVGQGLLGSRLVSALEASPLLCPGGSMICAMLPLLQHRSEAVKLSIPHLLLASALLADLVKEVPPLRQAAASVAREEGEQVLKNARMKTSRHAM